MPAFLKSALGPQDLTDLGYWLRERGISVHPSQILTASRLVIRTQHLRPAAEMAPWLAPIFCSNAVEQERFPELYAAWLGLDAAPTWKDANVGEAPGNVSHAAAVPFLHTWWPVVLVLSALLACGWMAWATFARPSIPVSPTPPASTIEVEAPSTPATLDFQPLDRVPASPAVSPAVDDPQDFPLNRALRAVAGLALFAALTWWLYAAARRRGFLERLPADDNETRRRLASSPVPALMAYGGELRYLSREMRRRRAVPSRRLDVRQTISATIRAGGLPQPIFGSHGEPGYLVMVEQVSAADHQSELADEVMRLMVGSGVAMERYVFDGDPRFSRHAPLTGRSLHAGPQSLEVLYARYPDARLIIFSDGNGLIDSITGQPAAFVRNLLGWPEPLLVTPQPARLWAQREWALAQAGLILLPLDAAGLRGLGRLLHQPTAGPGIDAAARGRKRPAYLRDVDLLLDRRVPDLDALKEVLEALQRDLGPQGMDWLAACAVYPDIHWSITLALGDCISRHAASGEAVRSRDEHYARQLAQLARLPWMRMGYMPDWLRTALLARLRPAVETAVRSDLDAFLASVRVAGVARGDSLEIALPSRSRRLRDALAGLRAWFRLAPRLETREDAIFLHFMNGPRRPLAVDANARLERLLYKNGLPLSGPRSWLPLASCALAAGMFFLPPLTWITPARPDAAPPAPVLLAFDDSADRLAVAIDTGRIVVRELPAKKGQGGRSRCGTTIPMPVPLGLAMGLSADYVYQTADGIMRTRLGSDCAIPKDRLPPEIAALVLDRSGRLSIGSSGTGTVADALCSNGSAGRFTIATRAVVDAALPAEARPAVACALADNSSALLVAARSAQLYVYPLDGTGPARIDRGELPSRTGSGRTLAISDVDGTIAVVTVDGRIQVSKGGRAFKTVDITGARPPLAISKGGETIAFANAQREVVVFRAVLLVDSPPPQTADSPARVTDDSRGFAQVTPVGATAGAAGSVGSGTPAGGVGTSATSATGPVASGSAPDRPITQPNEVNVDESINFSGTSFEIPQAGITQLNFVTQQLKGVDFYRLVVAGQVTGQGTNEYNMALGLRLADVVRSYLVGQGLPESRISAIAVPSYQPPSLLDRKRGVRPIMRVTVRTNGIRRDEQTEALPEQQTQEPQRNLEPEPQLQSSPVTETK